MSYTAAEIADGVWTHATRTTDGLAPAASDGTILDDIAYAVWTETVRTLDGGPSDFQITVAESMPAPSQAATAGTSMPVSIAESLPAPSQSSTLQTAINCNIVESLPAPTQTITAEAIEIFTAVVAESLPAPSQAIVADFTPGANPKPMGAGGPRGAWEYYPPIYAIRTKGSQVAPAPGQRGTIAANAKVEPVKPLRKMAQKPALIVRGMQSALTPSQVARVKSHRAVKDRDREDRDILALLASL